MAEITPMHSLRWSTGEPLPYPGYVMFGHDRGDCFRHAALGDNQPTKAGPSETAPMPADLDDDYDEPDYDDYPDDDYDDSPEPDWDREEYFRYLDLPWLGRLVYDLHGLYWRRTWRLRLKIRSRWLKLTGRADDWSDEPPVLRRTPMTTEPIFHPSLPPSPELTKAAADRIGELVRFLNHSTMPHNAGLKYPADADRLIAGLYVGTGRLPQLFTQLVSFLGSLTGLRDDQGREVSAQIALAAFRLGDAHGYAMQLTSALQAAQNAISGLSMKDSDDDS